jgi:hypothetical protein
LILADAPGQINLSADRVDGKTTDPKHCGDHKIEAETVESIKINGWEKLNKFFSGRSSPGVFRRNVMASTYRLELTRVGMEWEKINFEKSISGTLRVYRGEDLLGTFSTMERGIKFVHLKVGSYEMKHSIKGNPDGKGRDNIKCLRPVDLRIRSILIHDAASRRRTSLSGCIAPFFLGSEAYGPSSAEAMDALWEMIGKFQKGKQDVTLLVLTNPILGDERTKEQWIDGWAKRKKRH